MKILKSIIVTVPFLQAMSWPAQEDYFVLTENGHVPGQPFEALQQRIFVTATASRRSVSLNVQTAVDTRRHLIVAHEVTNTGSDRAQLYKLSQLAKEATGHDQIEALADRGYYSGEEIRSCGNNGITAYVPKNPYIK